VKTGIVIGVILFALCALSSAVSAQDKRCPQFSGVVKDRVEKQARWLVSESLQRQLAQRSSAFGRLIAIEQCDVLKTRVLSEGDMVFEGPFFEADSVPLESLIGRYQGTWVMAVAPTEVTGKMPDANFLELTDHKWTLFYRDENGDTRVVATGKY
jgi:hypothetical protein